MTFVQSLQRESVLFYRTHGISWLGDAMTGLFSCTVHFPTHTEPGSGLWDVWVLKGLRHSLYFETHLLKAPRNFLLPNYLSISQSSLNLLSQCLCKTKRHINISPTHRCPNPWAELLSCIRGTDKPFWVGFLLLRELCEEQLKLHCGNW